MVPGSATPTVRPKREPSDAAISVAGLSKRFRTGSGDITALEGVSLDVRQGEFVAIVGPSGCGKSTMLKMLTGLLRPTSGAIQINGTAVSGPRRDIGVVFQAPCFPGARFCAM